MYIHSFFNAIKHHFWKEKHNKTKQNYRRTKTIAIQFNEDKLTDKSSSIGPAIIIHSRKFSLYIFFPIVYLSIASGDECILTIYPLFSYFELCFLFTDT